MTNDESPVKGTRELFSAETALRESEKRLSDKRSDEIYDIMGEIQESCERGDTSAFVDYMLYEETTVALVSLGYKVVAPGANCTGHGGTLISWGPTSPDKT